MHVSFPLSIDDLVCNLHDISWGTKGDNQAPSLGGVTATQGKDGKQTVEIDFPSDKNEINSNYENFIQAMRQPKQQVKSKPDAKTRQDDYFRNFRTTTVLFWAFTNALLIVVLTTDSIVNAIYRSAGFQPEGDFNPYLKFIFYSVAGLSLVRFLGSISYLIGYHFCP
jgi:chitin synthase